MVARSRAAYMTAMTALNELPPLTLEALNIVEEEHRKSERELYRFHFDTWAWRNVHVVGSDADIEANDEWLANYLESFLEAASELHHREGVVHNNGIANISQHPNLPIGNRIQAAIGHTREPRALIPHLLRSGDHLSLF